MEGTNKVQSKLETAKTLDSCAPARKKAADRWKLEASHVRPRESSPGSDLNIRYLRPAAWSEIQRRLATSAEL